MCTLIHNILTTDFITLIKDDDSVRGLKVLHDAPHILAEYGVDLKLAKSMTDLFGVSGICNIIGAIKMAKYLRLSEQDNVVTIATDGFDRYDSVITDLNRRVLETEDFVLRRWFKDIFLRADIEDIKDVRGKDAKDILFKQKENDWLKFNYPLSYLNEIGRAHV